ncbi:hypothetical protein [Acrocarpospora phusangensis]|uniref:hypothetical protein n=1 Tax=Acrocarpospora phusangensis TaxID=1070424 RepID=UPI00194F6EF2|nr:hypothetical protein [Acrocarpospora phusangensis]
MNGLPAQLAAPQGFRRGRTILDESGSGGVIHAGVDGGEGVVSSARRKTIEEPASVNLIVLIGLGI